MYLLYMNLQINITFQMYIAYRYLLQKGLIIIVIHCISLVYIRIKKIGQNKKKKETTQEKILYMVILISLASGNN